MRQTLLCRNSSSKCAMRWPMWRGECYPPPCCSTAAGWAQSTLWYPTFKSRPFSLFVWHASPLLSLHCTVLRGTNSLASVCMSWCQSFWLILVVESQYCKPWFYLKMYVFLREKQDSKNFCRSATGVTLWAAKMWLKKQLIETEPECWLTSVTHFYYFTFVCITDNDHTILHTMLCAIQTQNCLYIYIYS